MGTVPAPRSTWAKVDRGVYAQAGKSARPENLERPNHLGGGEAQIERGGDHADFEAAVFEQNVIHGHGQQRDQVVALAEAEA